MTSVITPFVEKENASAVGVFPGKHSDNRTFGRSGLKTFQGNSNSVPQPRKALGAVNTDHGRTTLRNIEKPNIKSPSKSLFGSVRQFDCSSRKRSQQVSHKIRSHAPGPKVKHVEKQVSYQRKQEEEEIEKMHIYVPPEDDFEDIAPKSEQAHNYLEKLMNWRPSQLCSMGITYDSDDEPYVKTVMPPPTIIEEQEALEEPLDLADIPLPAIEDLHFDIDYTLDTSPEL